MLAEKSVTTAAKLRHLVAMETRHESTIVAGVALQGERKEQMQGHAVFFFSWDDYV